MNADGSFLYMASMAQCPGGTNQGGFIRKMDTTTYEVTSLAGQELEGHADGVGAEASFYAPSGIAVPDGTALFVADRKNNVSSYHRNGGLAL
jgi:DNA-binding beta-propeller fold protein YncE